MTVIMRKLSVIAMEKIDWRTVAAKIVTEQLVLTIEERNTRIMVEEPLEGVDASILFQRTTRELRAYVTGMKMVPLIMSSMANEEGSSNGAIVSASYQNPKSISKRPKCSPRCRAERRRAYVRTGMARTDRASSAMRASSPTWSFLPTHARCSRSLGSTDSETNASSSASRKMRSWERTSTRTTRSNLESFQCDMRYVETHPAWVRQTFRSGLKTSAMRF